MAGPRNRSMIGMNDRSEYHDSIERYRRDDDTSLIQKIEASASILEAVPHNSQYPEPQTGSSGSLNVQRNSTSASASTGSPQAISHLSQASNRAASVSRSNTSSPEITSSLPALIPSRPSSGGSSASSSFSSSRTVHLEPTYRLPLDEAPRNDGLQEVTDEGLRSLLEHIFQCPFDWLECYNRECEELQNLLKSIKHFRGRSPPNFAICRFCDDEFRHEDGNICWKQLMQHMADHHRNGADFAHSRLDPHLIRYMYQNSLIREDFYHLVIARYTTEILPGEPLYASPEIVERRIRREPEERPSYVPQRVRRANFRR